MIKRIMGSKCKQSNNWVIAIHTSKEINPLAKAQKIDFWKFFNQSVLPITRQNTYQMVKYSSFKKMAVHSL